jgi:hypothetical protein
MDEVKQPASLDSGVEAFFQSVVVERGLNVSSFRSEKGEYIQNT